MSELYKAYFIGGEWDGVIRRVPSYPSEMKVAKQTHIREKYKFMCGVNTETTITYDNYELVNHFPDGVLVYRLRSELELMRHNLDLRM